MTEPDLKAGADGSSYQHIFVVGFPRSGTTLLSAMLGSHPEIIATPESHFFRNLALKWNDIDQILSSADAAVDFLGQMSHYNGNVVEEFGLTPGQVRTHLREGPQNIKNLFVSLLAAYAAKHPKQSEAKFILEKTPSHLSYLRAIRHLFPASPIIRIVRDPRDVALSIQKMPWRPFTGKFSLAMYLETYFSRTDRFFAEDRRSLTIRMEDLVRHPEVTLSRVCSFCGTAYDSSMLDFQRSASSLIGPGEHWKTSTTDKLSASRMHEKSNELRIIPGIIMSSLLSTIAGKFDYQRPNVFLARVLKFTLLHIKHRKLRRIASIFEWQEWHQRAMIAKNSGN